MTSHQDNAVLRQLAAIIDRSALLKFLIEPEAQLIGSACLIVGIIVGTFIHIKQAALAAPPREITTLIATFLGAFLAFKLQNKRDDAARRRSNIEAGNRALFTLARMINEIDAVQAQVVEPFRHRADRFLVMPPFLIAPYEDFRFDIKSLIFFLESESANVLAELLIEETRFHQTMAVLQNRSTLHKMEVQPALEKGGVRTGRQYQSEEIEQILGQRLFTQIRSATDAVVEHVDRTRESSMQLMENVRAALIKIYPKVNFISIERAEKLV